MVAEVARPPGREHEVEILADHNRVHVRVIWLLSSLGEDLDKLIAGDQPAAEPGHGCAGGDGGPSEQPYSRYRRRACLQVRVEPAVSRWKADHRSIISARRGQGLGTLRVLGIAPKTVENVQTRLFRKLGVRNGSGALAVAGAKPPAALNGAALTSAGGLEGAHQAVLGGEERCSGAAGDAELRVDVLHVVGSRLRRDHQVLRDLLVGVPPG